MKVLLVEDTHQLRDNMATVLQRAGYAVDETGDGDEGLWFLRENDYAVVILDLSLPSRDGMELLARLRDSRKDTSVLIVSARDAVADRVAGLRAGADDYLVKPFALDEFVTRVQVLTRRRFGVRETTVEVGELSIDTMTRTARHGDTDLALTRMEFALLELLALRAGTLVARADIWEHLYDFDADASSNVVDVILARIRRKLRDAGAPPLIHTRRGEGYILRLPTGD